MVSTGIEEEVDSGLKKPRRMGDYFADLVPKPGKPRKGRCPESEFVPLEALLHKIIEGDKHSDEADEMLADSWLQIYRSSIDYLSRDNEICPAHLENLGSFEAVSDYFVERIDRNPTLAKQVGGISELDRALRKMIGIEYKRIERELEKREWILREALEEYEAISDPVERIGRLELLLGGADELIKMRKLANGELEGIVDFRGVVQGKINYARAAQRRIKTESKRVELYVEEERTSERDPIYMDIVRKNKEQLSRIGNKVGDAGVLDEAAIRSLFEVRDSCYSSIEALGLKTPVAEIEEVMDRISERDKGLIDEFISICEGKSKGDSLTKKGVREAEAYIEILNAWKRYI